MKSERFCIKCCLYTACKQLPGVPRCASKAKESRPTVQAKRPVQQRKADICPHCGSGVVFVKGSIIHSPCFICGRRFDPHTGKGKRSTIAHTLLGWVLQ